MAKIKMKRKKKEKLIMKVRKKCHTIPGSRACAKQAKRKSRLCHGCEHNKYKQSNR